MRFIKTSLLLLNLASFAGIKAKLFQPKFNIKQIRAIKSENLSYQQSRNGHLQMTKNTKTKDLIKHEDDNVFYKVILNNPKIIGIEKKVNFFTDLNLRKNNHLFISELGSSKVMEIGKGLNLNLHLDGIYASFSKINEQKISILNLKNNHEHSLTYSNKWNPYFRPEVVMNYGKDIFYNDYSKNGLMRVMQYNLKSKKKKVFITAKSQDRYFKFCSNESKGMIYILNTSLDFKNKEATSITDLYGTNLYLTDFRINGPLICHDEHLIFVKENNKEKLLTNKKFEAIAYSLKDSSLTTLHKSSYNINIFKQDDKVFFLNEDLYYEVKQ